jgi:hypothetical protein
MYERRLVRILFCGCERDGFLDETHAPHGIAKTRVVFQHCSDASRRVHAR